MLTSNIARDENGSLLFAGQKVSALADRYATPLYLMDEARIRENCRMYKDAFRAAFGDAALPLYAGKACAFKQMYRIMAEEGMGVDAVSRGEIYTALAAGFPASRIWFHGDGKTDEDIRFALENGVGFFVVDGEEELYALNAEAARRGIRQKILLRVTPGIDPHTYEAVNTGRVDVKFGVPIGTGQALAFVKAALGAKHVELCGLHCHVGSMVFDESVFEDTADLMFAFMRKLRDELGYVTGTLDLGGGYGVRYVEADKRADIPGRIAALACHMRALAEETGLPMPEILMEPGRSIVADAGLTVYTVSAVKRIPGFKNHVIVDGGMTDNPRYCLYGSRYTVLPAETDAGETAVFDLAGRCCESGDILQPAVTLPAGTKRGDRVAVCTTGAYNYAMASNYNRLGRPPVVMLRDGESYVAVQREGLDTLCALDV